jgi:hypothetical protein
MPAGRHALQSHAGRKTAPRIRLHRSASLRREQIESLYDSDRLPTRRVRPSLRPVSSFRRLGAGIIRDRRHGESLPRPPGWHYRPGGGWPAFRPWFRLKTQQSIIARWTVTSTGTASTCDNGRRSSTGRPNPAVAVVVENEGTAPADDVHVEPRTAAAGRRLDELPQLPPPMPGRKDPFDLDLAPSMPLADVRLPSHQETLSAG